MSETLKAALDYAKRGWHIIPVHSVQDNGFCSCGAPGDYTSEPKHMIGKHPYTGIHGHRESSDTPMQINTWWIEFPNPNVAIVSGAKSGLIILDVDKKNGGLESLAKLQRQHGKLPDTPLVHSGGGGLHFYFSHPGFEVRGRRGMLPGLDVQADGGRIVAPPSKHVSGKTYEWDTKFGPDTKVAAIPKWLLSMILEKQSKRPLKSTLNGDEQEKLKDSRINVLQIRGGGGLLSRSSHR